MRDILKQDNILFSVRSGSAVCEARTEQEKLKNPALELWENCKPQLWSL